MAKRRRTPYVVGDDWTRFWAKVALGPVPEWRPDLGPCWLWTAGDTGGYGVFSLGSGRTIRAHRWAYTRLRGGCPPQLHLDHLCAVRNCVNAAHLEPVECGENTRRQVERHVALGTWHRSGRTHCKRGHALAEHGKVDNRGHRNCRVCANAWKRANYVPRLACRRGHLYPEAEPTPGRHRRCAICHPTRAEREALA